MPTNDDDLIKMYRWMVLTRAFETRTIELQYQRNIPEMLHSSIGQEAIGVGACYGLRPDDQVIPSLRNQAAFLVRGVDPGSQLAAMFGKATGAARGKQTSHHRGEPELGLIAGSGIVGGSIAVAVGVALGWRLQASDRVTLVFFGDGGSNRGDLHEAANLAAVLKLGVVFICENNQYAMSTPISRHMAITDVSNRAAAWGIPGVTVDGNDVIAVHETVQAAVARARAGDGPSLIECKTYRWRGHSERDLSGGAHYRPVEEVEAWKERCPIKRLREQLLATGALRQELVDEIDREVAETLVRAVEFAEQSPYPSPEEALRNVYSTSVGGRRR